MRETDAHAPPPAPALRASEVPFAAHIDLLQLFTAQRAAIVASIEQLLNCQKKPLEYQQHFALLAQQFKNCFFNRVSAGAHLRDQLEHAHWVAGFKPRATPGNALVDPVEQMVRAFHMWRLTHWPGQKGRERFAQTLFNLFMLRSLALLCMRVWDAGDDTARTRLSQAQALLDAVWHSAPADQPRLVRDVRWLFPVAMSPTTDSLEGYFPVAAQIAERFAEADGIETQRAWVQTGAGHLRSQLYHLAARRNVDLADHSLVLITRMSNALDLGLLLQGLVPLLAAYERCLRSARDASERRQLASAILQGISPDPELFVNRVDLLAPYTMIEHLFITTDAAGTATYTAMGERHVALLRRYADLMARLAQPLYADCLASRPLPGGYSPYGVLYGFASNLLELMAFKTLQRDADHSFSMEDIFSPGDARKRAWVDGWRNLPHIKPDVIERFQYPEKFADAIHTRIEQALARAAAVETSSAAGRLYLLADAASANDPTMLEVPALAAPYLVTSDPELAAAHQVQCKDEADLLHCRLEGEFLVSYRTPGGWFAITKDLLTDIPGAGRDAKIVGLPAAAASVLRLMGADLVVMPAA